MMGQNGMESNENQQKKRNKDRNETETNGISAAVTLRFTNKTTNTCGTHMPVIFV